MCIYIPFQTQNTSSKRRNGIIWRGKSHTGMVYSSIYFDLCNQESIMLVWNTCISICILNFVSDQGGNGQCIGYFEKIIDCSLHDFICSDISSPFVFTIFLLVEFVFFGFLLIHFSVFFPFSTFLTKRQKKIDNDSLMNS